MSIVLAFTPARRVAAIESSSAQGMLPDVDAGGDADRRIAKVANAFAASQAAGLFTLATEKLDATLAPSLVYWRSFAGRYLTELCHAPDPSRAATPAPESTELDAIVLSAPPMQGAEYLTSEALAEIWSDLDAWVRAEGAAFDGGLSGFLKRRAPVWHQVGRVCFHLAENRRDPDYPFAFLATYAPTDSPPTTCPMSSVSILTPLSKRTPLPIRRQRHGERERPRKRRRRHQSRRRPSARRHLPRRRKTRANAAQSGRASRRKNRPPLADVPGSFAVLH